MTRTILVQLDVNDPPAGHEVRPSDEELAAGIAARLDEFYPSADLHPWQPFNLRIAVTTPAGSQALVSGANVALDFADEATTGFPAEALDAGAKAAQDIALCFECKLRGGHRPDCANGMPPS